MSRNADFADLLEDICVTSREGRVSRNLSGLYGSGIGRRHVPRGTCE